MTDDERIVELFFQRSERAVRELDDKYGAACRRLAYGIVNSYQDAEECVNDAYLGAWNAIPPTRPSPLLPYIMKIVRNISLNRYWKTEAGKRSSRYTVALAEIEDCIADDHSVEAELEAKELAGYIEEFLDAQSPENRVIFMRRYWFADSCKEIGRLTGLTEKNVSVRLTRIRKKLKEHLTKKEVSI